MHLNVTTHGRLTLVSGLPKMFDYTVCPEFQRQLAAHLEAAPAVVAFDLSGVEFVDSSAIGSLITVRNRLLAGGGTVALCSIAESVGKVLRIADLGKVFTLYPDTAAAMAACQA
jgi:anti-anti-sigma factor